MKMSINSFSISVLVFLIFNTFTLEAETIETFKWIEPVQAKEVNSNTYYVDSANGDDLNDGQSIMTAFASIQKGIDSAQDADMVLVYPGVYTESISFKGRSITVQGIANTSGVPVLIGSDDFAVSFDHNEGPSSVLKNFIIKNNIIAILIDGCSPKISNVTIANNECGIEANAGSKPDIRNSIFWNNVSSDLSGCQACYSWIQEDIEPEQPKGLVSYWSFDEGIGTTIYDSAGDKRGIIHGAQWTDGQIGGALSFDGVDDYVALPDNDPIWLPQNNFTLSVWVYFERESDFPINELILDLNYANSDDSYNELGYNILVHNQYDLGKLGFQMTTTTNSDEDLHSNEIPTRNIWYHIVAIRNDSIQAFYINGKLDESRICSPDLIDFIGGYDDDKVNIARYTTTIGQPRYYFQGKIDDLCIYDRALSNKEIQQLYQNGLNGSGFVTNPLFADPANDDYHLRSKRGRYWPEHDVWVLDKVTSPCIDGGDPYDDYSNEPMPNGSCINIGAFGGTPYASMSETEIQWFDPDVNADGILDISDLTELIELWLKAASWME